jgi:transketolase
MSATMRERFYETTAELVNDDERMAVVLADIGVGRMPAAERAHPDRVINVGIREQLMVGVASGLALTGFRPIVHSFAPFVVERPFEMLKVDLGHVDVGAIVVSVGASYDVAVYGRTHETPEDVALIAALPGWRIYVPGHPAEADQLLRAAALTDERVYLRLSEQSNQLVRPITPGRLHVERRGVEATVIAAGPLLDATLEATADMDMTVLYMTTARPLDADTLRASLTGDLVVLIEPYQAGTSSAEVSAALADIPHRIAAIGVPNIEHRKYGTWQEHNAAHGLDARGIRARILRALARNR